MSNAPSGEPVATPVHARLFPMHYAVEAGKTYAWCSCGKSAKQPFCDGSHKGTAMRPVMWTATESKKVLFCMCKESNNKPLCDLTHIKVIRRLHGAKIAAIGVAGAATAAMTYKTLFPDSPK